MLTILGRAVKQSGSCDNLSRRSFLKIGGAAMGGLSLSQLLSMEAQAGIAREVASKVARFHTNGTTMTAVNVPGVDLPNRHPDQLRVLHFHHNVPGVLSALHAAIVDLNANIHAEYLQSVGNVSYVILDVDRVDVGKLRTGLEAIPETIRLRVLD